MTCRIFVKDVRVRRGYTLIEILVVLFIIGIVSSAALLTMGRNENKEVESFAHDLTERMTLALEQAMLQPSVLGLTVSEHSFQFSTFHREDGQNNTWTLIQNATLGQHSIPSDIQIGVEIAGHQALFSNDETASNTPQIIISTNGEITPFTLYVGKKGEKPRYVIRGDADGNITNEWLS